MHYDIPLKPDTIAALQNMRKLIARDLSDDGNDVLGIMSHYCQFDRGTPAYGSLGIDPDLIEKFTGTVAVEFQEQEDNGCKDKDKQEDHQVEIRFSISIANKTLTLDVPESSRVRDWHSS
jgi:hypothetical protein